MLLFSLMYKTFEWITDLEYIYKIESSFFTCEVGHPPTVKFAVFSGWENALPTSYV